MDLNALSPAQTAAIDLHGMTTWQAEDALVFFLDGLPKAVKAVEVTHGYSHGTALKRMVKNDFWHHRVTDKQVGLNPGVTYLILK